ANGDAATQIAAETTAARERNSRSQTGDVIDAFDALNVHLRLAERRDADRYALDTLSAPCGRYDDFLKCELVGCAAFRCTLGMDARRADQCCDRQRYCTGNRLFPLRHRHAERISNHHTTPLRYGLVRP